MRRAPYRIKRSRRGTTFDRRGVALIMVLTAIAIFTAVVVDFAYETRVELDLAANARDEVRAYFLARSAVGFSRLILHFQKQLDASPIGGGQLGSMLGGLLGGGSNPLTGGAGAAGAGAANPLSGGLVIRLWELIPIDSGMLQMFLGAADNPTDDTFGKTTEPDKGASDSLKFKATTDAPEFGSTTGPGGKGAKKKFGDFSGSFHADVEDEEKKFNIARLDNLARVMQVAITEALMMFGDKRYEWIFDQEDAYGNKTTPKDLLVYIHDYIDADQVGSALNPLDPVNPFTAGFSDETEPYSRYKPVYKPKNAPLDSLEELNMVTGITDTFMSAFRNRLTVYPDKNKAININTDDPFMQMMNVFMAAANPNDPKLQNPLVIATIMQQIQLSKLFSGMGMTVDSFVSILQTNGITPDPSLTTNAAGNLRITDKSETFTIHGVGEVGKVQKKLTVVVRTDQGLGKLLYWREE